VAQCVTCGSELHPERAEKYDYCLAPECQRKNLKPLTMVAVGVNKSAEQYLLLDDKTRDDLAQGKFHDQRRGSFGTSTGTAPTGTTQPGTAQPEAASTGTAPAGTAPAGTAPAGTAPAGTAPARPLRPSGPPAGRPSPARPTPSRPTPRRPWSRSQEKLALLYNEQGRRPDEIAQKLGLSTYLVTQIILTSKNRAKL
jgi:hypothetical protein